MRFLKELTHLTTIIGYANNCLNPVLYVFLSDSFREEYLIVLNCFHLTGLNYKNNKSDGNIQQIENKTKKKQRKSVLLRKRREIALKKVKHSVAIDDIPSEYRTHSFHSHRQNDQKRCSTSSMLTTQVIGYDKKDLEHLPNYSCQPEVSQQKSSNNKSNHSPIKRVTVQIAENSTHFPTSIIDDGGVYCGD
jgi:hypothetical protein